MGVARPWSGLTRRAFIQSAAAAALLACERSLWTALPAGAASSAGIGTVYSIPNSIPSDGSSEVSQAINDWITSIPNGTPGAYNVAQFATNGVYWTDSTIQAVYKAYVTFAGNGSTFVRRNQLPGTAIATRKRSHWRFNHCAFFTYDNLHVEGEANPTAGYNSALEAQHAFSHMSSVQSQSNHCTANNVWGDGFNFACNISGQPAAHHRVSNFSSGIVHRQSVSVTTGNDITFSSCHFGQSARSGVDLEPNSNSGFATNILFEDCSWAFHALNWLAAAPQGGIVSDVTMSRCTDNSPMGLMVTCDPTYTVGGVTPVRANFTIDSCTSTTPNGGPSGAIMNFDFTTGTVTVTNNVQPLQPNLTPPMRVARFDAYTTANAVITYQGNTPDLG